MTPEQPVSRIDFRFIADALTPLEALDMPQRSARARAAREQEIQRVGFPAYTTSRRLARIRRRATAPLVP